jgi:hypothetical protein
VTRHLAVPAILAVLLTGAPAAHAGASSTHSGGCRWAVEQRDLDYDVHGYDDHRHLWTGVIYSDVRVYSTTATENPVSATVTCTVRINAEPQVSVTFAGTGVITGAKRVSFYSSLYEYPGSCYAIDYTSDDTPTDAGCPDESSVQVVPYFVWDALDPTLDTLPPRPQVPIPVPPECSDGIDNDRDGAVDYPADTECRGPDYDAEGLQTPERIGPPPPGPCSTVGTVTACASLTPRTVFAQYTAYEASYLIDKLADATLALYEFTLPNGGTVELPCVEVAQPVAADPCAAAGGTWVQDRLRLVQYDPLQNVDQPAASVALCTADLTVTVNDVGVSSAPAYAPC